MKKEKFEGYDGSKLINHFDLLQAQYDIDLWKNAKPDTWKDLFPVVLKGVKGKAIICSTVELGSDNEVLFNIWNESDKPNGLFRIFRPALGEVDNYGFKKEDDEKIL
jgi:hypothetical protein